MSDALDAIPAESSAVIVDELAHRDPALLAQLRATADPSNELRDAVMRLLVRAVIKNLEPDQSPNEHGLAIERAINAFLEAWPISR